MKYLLIFIIAVSQLQCSTISRIKYRQFGEFAKYVESFVTEGEKRGKHIDVSNLTIGFNNEFMNAHIVGGCLRTRAANGGLTGGTIRIKADIWKEASTEHREELIYHEMGHCVLDREHNDEETFEGRPKSYMHPSLLVSNNNDYESRKTEYLDELFKDMY
jgi:hypothetical protein